MDAPIVVGVDFSRHGRRALASATALARDLACPLVLVHAFPRRFLPPDADPSVAERIGRLEGQHDVAEAERLTTEWANHARNEGVEVRTVATDGRPSDVILEAAGREQAAMIVVGTHSRGAVARVLLGSVAEQVVRRSRVPVLVVPAPE